MNNLFSQRRNQLWNHYLKYARLAFNNHFVVFLLFAIVFGIYAYRDLLTTVTANFWTWFILILISIATLFFGRLVTYAKPADQVFLFADEVDGRKLLQQAFRYSIMTNWGMMIFIFLIATPFALKISGLAIWLLIVFVLLIIKLFLLLRTKNRIQHKNNSINWRLAVMLESNRQQRINRFYSMFTDVKGLRTKVKKRSYLNWFRNYILRANSSFYSFFYSAKFIRGQYFGLIIRLMLVGLFLILVLARNNWKIAAVIIFIFSYLIGFQILPLYYEAEQTELTKIYPLNKNEKTRAIITIITNLLIIFSVVAIAIFLIYANRFNSLELLVAALIIIVILTRIYLPWRLRK